MKKLDHLVNAQKLKNSYVSNLFSSINTYLNLILKNKIKYESKKEERSNRLLISLSKFF